MRTGIPLALALLLLAGLLAWLFSGGGVPVAEEPFNELEATAPLLGAAKPGVDPEPDGAPAPEPPLRHPAGLPALPGLSGRLLRDGRALAGVELRAVVDSRDAEEAGRCTTCAEGLFFLALPAGRYSLEARGADVPRGFTIHHIELVHGQHRDLGSLIVPSGVTISGRVIDPQGAPLSGARVYARTGMGLQRDRSAASLGFRLDVLDPQAAEADANVLTGADGRFAIGGLLPGTVLVLAEHPEHWSRTASHEVEPGSSGDIGDLGLLPARPLRGYVFDHQGTPVGDARVTPGGRRMEPSTSSSHAVRTGPDGAFVLQGALFRRSFTVEKDGFVPLFHEARGFEPLPLKITLRPALILEGTVIGNQGRVGAVGLMMAPGRDRSWPGWVDERCAGPHQVAADGRFRIAGLPAGLWWVMATVPGIGSTPVQWCTLPLEAPLELRLVPDRTIAVTVVDDLGTPIPNATLAWMPANTLRSKLSMDLYKRNSVHRLASERQAASDWRPRWDRLESQADAQGKAVAHIPGQEPLQLAASAPSHLSASIALEPDPGPAPLEIVLARGGVLHGSVAHTDLMAHVRLSVTCTLQGNEAKHEVNVPVDAAGRFRTPALPPGNYLVHWNLSDPTLPFLHFDTLQPAPLPLLSGLGSGSGASRLAGDPVLVEAAPGRETEVGLPAPRCGEVCGRVLAGGLPVARAIVYGIETIETQDQPPWWQGWPPRDRDYLDAFEFHPHLRTDAQGRFRFLAGSPGTFSLYARHSRGAGWSQPIHLQLDLESRLERDIVLPTGAIRGSFALAQIKPTRRIFLRARLCRLQYASLDPDRLPGPDPRSLRPRSLVHSTPLGATGAFAFECLAPGIYVLRLEESLRQFLLTRVLEVAQDQCIDLGLLEPDLGVRPTLRTGLQPELDVMVRMPVEGSEGVWIRTVGRDRDGAMNWGTMVPGQYLLYAFRTAGPGAGIVGDPVAVEVSPDGSCAPEVVWPDGIRE